MRIKDARQTFLGVWIKNILEKKEILVYGDGRQIRDFNYVDDVVKALLMTARSEEYYGSIFNLGSEEPINLVDTAKLLIKSAGTGKYKLIPFPLDRKSIDIGNYYADYRKIKSSLGWTSEISLEEGLSKTYNYYKKFGKYYLN
jgi:UDP-glucose 4-epimerase